MLDILEVILALTDTTRPCLAVATGSAGTPRFRVRRRVRRCPVQVSGDIEGAPSYAANFRSSSPAFPSTHSDCSRAPPPSFGRLPTGGQDVTVVRMTSVCSPSTSRDDIASSRPFSEKQLLSQPCASCAQMPPSAMVSSFPCARNGLDAAATCLDAIEGIDKCCQTMAANYCSPLRWMRTPSRLRRM
jgi:hypothetical protein